MDENPLRAPFAKIYRAKSQIDEIERRIQAWTDLRPYQIRQTVNRRDPGEIIWSYFVDDPPDELALVVGETLHNIRSPLDNMLAAVSERNGGSSNQVAFPFNNSENAFAKHSLPKQRNLLPAAAIEVIVAAKPYRGGDDLLWGLHELNRIDKHRADLVAFAHLQQFLLTSLVVTGSDALVVGSRAGQHMVIGGYVPSPRHPFASNETEFFTGRPGAQLEIDFEPQVGIAFGKIESLSREPIAEVLTRMRDRVEGLLFEFQRRFFS